MGGGSDVHRLRRHVRGRRSRRPPTDDADRHATTVSSTGAGTGDATGIEVSIGAPGQILAGTRAAIDVTIRNAGVSTV